MVLLHSSESHIQPLGFERQAFMIDSETMQDRGVHVVDMHGVTDDVVAKVVRFTVDDTGHYSTPGHPHGEAARMMVAPVVVAR